jgi:plasmid stability protein
MNLSIKNAPEALVRRLKERAARNHRSLQGELMAIIEAAVGERRRMMPVDVLAEVRRIGLSTPGESVDIVRKTRDGRRGR